MRTFLGPLRNSASNTMTTSIFILCRFLTLLCLLLPCHWVGAIQKPTIALTLRPSELGGTNYPLFPFDATIDVQNLSSEPARCAAFLFSRSIPRTIDLHENNLWRIWSPDGRDRRILDVDGRVGTFELKNWPPCPEIQPGGADHVRQVLRLVRRHDLRADTANNRPLVEEVFLFPKPGIYVMELEETVLNLRSNRLTIEVQEPVGRDREAYQYLLQSQYPFFASGYASPGNEEERAEVEQFLARYGDTVYAPYARFYLSLCERKTAWQDLVTSGVVRSEDFLRVWDDLLADKNFRLWPWVLSQKAEYLEQLGTPQRRFDPATQKMVGRPIQRVGQILQPDQQEAIWQQGKSVRETLQREYPYFPD